MWPLLIVLAIGCVPAYFVWPSGVMDMPLSADIVGDFVRMVGTAAVLLVGAARLQCLCRSTTNPGTARLRSERLNEVLHHL